MIRSLLVLSDRLRQRARRRTMSDPDQALGIDAEDHAHRYLQSRGLTVIARNWKTRSGWAEADLIAEDRAGVLVFVEVKARRTGESAAPDREITPEKKRKIGAVAEEYCRLSNRDPDLVRFDVVAVVFEPKVAITHYESAWSAAEAWSLLP